VAEAVKLNLTKQKPRRANRQGEFGSAKPGVTVSESGRCRERSLKRLIVPDQPRSQGRIPALSRPYRSSKARMGLYESRSLRSATGLGRLHQFGLRPAPILKAIGSLSPFGDW
jgi:hypothetical protein